MSLHQLAKHVQSQGRGKDTQLIHMSPREIKGLQALAKAHGGSLTINPETGLPEAGFLEQVLPIVAAAAATYFTAGAAAPALSAALGSTMAGGILAGAGAGALISGGTAAIQGGDVGKAALMGGVGGAIAGGVGGISSGGEGAVVEGAGTSMTPSANAISAAPATPAPPVDVNQATNILNTTGTQLAPISPTTGAPIPSGSAGVGVQPGGPGAGIDFGAKGMPVPQGSGISAGPSPAQLSNPSGIQGLTNTPAPNAGDIAARPQLPPKPEGWWANQSPWEKAGYATAGAGIIAGMNPQQTMPTTDTTEEDYSLQRISPNFKGQEPIRPNPYYRAKYPVYAANGGLMGLAMGGGPVEQMSNQITGGQFYPQGQQEHTNFATPTQMPTSAEVVASDYQPRTNPFTGTETARMATGGISSLGGYSDGGHLLKGPGDGVSDSIPASIGDKQPARLADGEFVLPARIVSEIGNGSTEAGARKLYAMMDRIQSGRKKSVGKGKVAVDSKMEKELLA